MRRCLGIDLGTSSVKFFLSGDRPRLISAPYRGDVAETVREGVAALCPEGDIEAVGLSGQTGTYRLLDADGEPLYSLSWHDPGRDEHLARVLSDIPQETFLRLTGMRHPRLASYPLPTLYLLRALGLREGLLVQPKDELVLRMTGEPLTDPGSWRALIDPATGAYPHELIRAAGAEGIRFPAMRETARIKDTAFGLKPGTPLYVGLNDFYASLLGLGMDKAGDAFDVTGTSEHIGALTENATDTPFVSSPYRGLFALYGGTASGGVALSWARRTWPDVPGKMRRGAPIFLPYLRGERAPVFDEKARGVFLGVSDQTDPSDFAYAAREGIAFSVYQIARALDIRTNAYALCGGAARDALLTSLKASLLDAAFVTSDPDGGSAAGAARAAGGEWPARETVIRPDPALRDFLLERYAVYEQLYDAWKLAAGDSRVFD